MQVEREREEPLERKRAHAAYTHAQREGRREANLQVKARGTVVPAILREAPDARRDVARLRGRLGIEPHAEADEHRDRPRPEVLREGVVRADPQGQLRAPARLRVAKLPDRGRHELKRDGKREAAREADLLDPPVFAHERVEAIRKGIGHVLLGLLVLLHGALAGVELPSVRVGLAVVPDVAPLGGPGAHADVAKRIICEVNGEGWLPKFYLRAADERKAGREGNREPHHVFVEGEKVEVFLELVRLGLGRRLAHAQLERHFVGGAADRITQGILVILAHGQRVCARREQEGFAQAKLGRAVRVRRGAGRGIVRAVHEKLRRDGRARRAVLEGHREGVLDVVSRGGDEIRRLLHAVEHVPLVEGDAGRVGEAGLGRLGGHAQGASSDHAVDAGAEDAISRRRDLDDRVERVDRGLLGLAVVFGQGRDVEGHAASFVRRARDRGAVVARGDLDLCARDGVGRVGLLRDVAHDERELPGTHDVDVCVCPKLGRAVCGGAVFVRGGHRGQERRARHRGQKRDRSHRKAEERPA